MEVPSPAALVGGTGPGPVDWDRELERVERGFAAVEAALVRLDEGTYGTCELCARPIAEGVLAEAPTTSRCPDHR